MGLQTDDVSLPARRLGVLLAGLAADGDADIALSLLQGWDGRLGRDSAAAAVQEVWWMRHLKPALLDAATNDAVARALLAPGDTESLLAQVEAMDDPSPLLLRTLAAAVTECRTRLGDDIKGWAWGRLHHGFFPHRLGRVAEGMRDVGPLAKGGSGATPMAAAYRISDFRMTSGASFRMVVDVGNWDNSRCINAPGQSGNPASAHYDDLSPLWAAGDYVPMLYSAEAIDAAAETRIFLAPA
jgi:penicillin amidase